MKKDVVERFLSPVGPQTCDDESRSVEIVIATQQRCKVYSRKHGGQIEEILLMRGLKLPDSMPLLDQHMTDSIGRNLGSVTGIRDENGLKAGRAVFSESEENTYRKVKEGHLKNFSLGYFVEKDYWIPAGKTEVVEGREEKGPCRVVTESTGFETSLCLWGADKNCVSRSNSEIENTTEQEREAAVSKINQSVAEAAAEVKNENKPKIESKEVKTEVKTTQENEQRSVPQPQVNLQVEISAALEADRKRMAEIMRMATVHKASEALVSRALSENFSVEQFGLQILNERGQQRTTAPVIEMVHDEGDQYRKDLVEYAMFRSDPGLIAEPTPGVQQRQGWSIMQVVQEMAQRNAIPLNAGPWEMVERTATTDDFKEWMAAVTEKAVYEGFKKASSTWEPWVGRGSVNDLTPHEAHQLSGFGNLERVEENGEYPMTSLAQSKEMFRIFKYGRRYKITIEMLINDQMNFLTQIPMLRGAAVARTISDMIYYYLVLNPMMGDGHRLFSAQHKNIASVGAGLNISALDEADNLMAEQVDPSGNMVDVEPRYFIAPRSLRNAAREIFESKTQGTQEKPNVANTFEDLYTRVFERRLNLFDPNTWFLASDKGTSINLYGLGGSTKPTFKFIEDLQNDGWIYKVRLFAGVKAIDWRGLVVHPGSEQALDMLQNPDTNPLNQKMLALLRSVENGVIGNGNGNGA